MRGKVARQNPTDGSFRIFNPAIGQHDIADRGHVLMSRENHATDRGLDAGTIYKINFYNYISWVAFLAIEKPLRHLSCVGQFDVGVAHESG